MKKHIAMHSLILFIGTTSAMEREDWEKTPGQPLGGSRGKSIFISPTRRPSSPPRRPTTPRASAAPVSAAPATGPTTAAITVAQQPSEPIDIQSNVSTLPHIINPQATQYSQTLTTMLDVSEIKQSTIILPDDFTDDQLYLITEMLNFIVQHVRDLQALPLQQTMVDFIRNRTNNFERISFIDALAIVNYLDIPLAFDALVSMRQPLPLPRNEEEELRYNQQLFSVAQLIRQSRDQRLWQLFGSMLYPRCLEYPECAEIVAHMPVELNPMVAGSYVQRHPKLYQHVMYSFKNISRVEFSSDGQIIAAKQKDRMIFINEATGTIIGTIKTAFFPQFSPNSKIIAVQQGDTIVLINPVTGSVIHTINNVYNPQFSPNSQIITAQQGDNIVLIDVITGAIAHTINNVSNPYFSPNGQIIVAYKGANIVFINALTGAIMHTIAPSKNILFSPNSEIIAMQQDDTIVLINPITGSVIHTINNAKYLEFSPNSQIITAQQGDTLILINVITGTITHTINHVDYPNFSPNSERIVAQQGVNIVLINATTGTIMRTIDNGKFPVFSPNGQILVVRKRGDTRSGDTILINALTGNDIRTINNVYNPVFSSNGEIIAVSQEGGLLILINITTGAIIHTFYNSEGPQFSPDGRFIAIKSLDTLEIRGYATLQEALHGQITTPPIMQPSLEKALFKAEATMDDSDDDKLPTYAHVIKILKKR